MSTLSIAQRTRWSIATVISCCLAIAASVNAIMFSANAATPLLQADAWYFLERVITKYFDGSLSILDLFAQRGSGDHSQPIQKLILLWHTHFFDMDFRVEGILGATFGVAFCALLALPLAKLSNRQATAHTLQAGLIAALFLVGLSLNATNIYTWPLVTIGFSVLIVAVAAALSITWSRLGESVIFVFLVSFVLGLLTDEQGVIFAIALMLAMLMFHKGTIRQQVPNHVGIILGIIASRFALTWIANRQGVSAAPFEDRSNALSFLSDPDALQAFFIPLQDSLLHEEHLAVFLGLGTVVRWFCIAFVGLVHVWMWVSLVRARISHTKDVRLVLATFLLLTSYAVLLGIVVNRVSEFGWSYLHQPRYVFYYQLPLLSAILILHQKVGEFGQSSMPHRRFATIPAYAFLLVILTVQLFVSYKAWHLPPYLHAYWVTAAEKMEDIRVDPQADVSQCPDIIEPCKYSVAHRLAVMDFLYRNKLNLYSPKFQNSTGLRPSAKATARISVRHGSKMPAAQGVSSNGMLVVETANIDLCTHPSGVVASTIVWNAASAKTEGTQIWLADDGKAPVLWSAAGAASSARTGNWLRHGTDVILVNGENNEELARVEVKAIPCD